MATRKIFSDLYVDGEITANKVTINGQYSLPTTDGSTGQILLTNGAGTVSFSNISALGLLDPSSIVNGTGLTWTQVSPGILQGDVNLSPFSTTDLVEGSRLYFTNERVDDRVNALLLAGTGLTKSYNDGANSLTLGVSLAPFSTTDLIEGSRLYFTNERVDDRVNDLIQDSATVTWTYNDSLNTLTANATTSPLEIQKDGTIIGSRNKIDFITGSNSVLTVIDDSLNSKVTVQIDSNVGALSDLSDVLLSSPVPGDILVFNGSAFQNSSDTAVIQLGPGLGSSFRVNNNNLSSGNYSTVSGGTCNIASSCYSTISGGYGNTSSCNNSTVSGGYANLAAGFSSTVAGGCSNIANENASTVSGGFNNAAEGCLSTIGGGSNNIACNLNSTVSGGYINQATQDYSTVSGGYSNCANGRISTVSGGCSNTTSGVYSVISGGYSNTTSNYSSTVGGGYGSTASGPYSVVGGGRENVASGQCAAVAGGYLNTAAGATSTISGGSQNTASGDYSIVAGGFCNTVTHDYSGAAGCNITSVCSNTFHVNNLNLFDVPSTDSSNTAVLVRESATGQVKLRYHGGMFAQTADGSTVSATVAETAIISTGVGTLTVPANGFTVGDSFSVTMGGLISSANGETVTIRVKSGSTVLATTGAVSLPAISGKAWKLQIDFTIRAVGAATVAAIVSNGQFSFSNASADILGADLGGLENTNFDTTISNTLSLTAQWGSTNATNSIKSTLFVLNKNY